MELTPRLNLPLLVAGQIQKEWLHNEALTLVDLLFAGTVEAGPVGTPPETPVANSFYLVAASGTSGAFAGMEGQLAAWTAGGWRFVSAPDGLRLTVRSSGLEMVRRGGAWATGSVLASDVTIGGKQVLGNRAAAIAAPSGGTVIDVQARASLTQILSALRAHGLIEP